MDFNKNVAIIGSSPSDKVLSSLSKLCSETIILPPFDKLGAGVSAHADMLVFMLDNKIFSYEEYVLANETIFNKISSYGYEIIRVKEDVGCLYPDDIALNALVVGKYIFCHTDHISRKIKDIATAIGYEIINVKQGYARCSACPISDRAIITADRSIALAAQNLGIDVLTISSGNILLPPFEYGFIGGTCGVSDNTVYFSGDVNSHPDGEKIIEFCIEHKKEPVSLSDEPLYDIGSIFFL